MRKGRIDLTASQPCKFDRGDQLTEKTEKATEKLFKIDEAWCLTGICLAGILAILGFMQTTVVRQALQ